MKLRTFAKSAALFSMLTLGIQAPAMAHKVVHVQGTLYVIICEPGGQAFTFNGTSTGAGEIGGYLCPTAVVNGGTDPNSTWQVIEARPAHEAAHVVQQGAGKPSTAVRKDCPAGTHWYEPAKACVANGGHPSPRSGE